MKSLMRLIVLLFATVIANAEPPFTGTIFIDPNILTESDPTTFVSILSNGRGSREMFDRRIDHTSTVEAYLFTANYSDDIAIEFQVNPEFGSDAEALDQVEYFAPVIGRLPRVLRQRVKTVAIHQGNEPYGGDDTKLLIHTGRISQQYIDGGILEETLIHEASHAALDRHHAYSGDWFMAQTNDGGFISTYSRDNRFREDVAESFLPYLALRYRCDRISDELAQTIETTIPNRIAYFDAQKFDLFPLQHQQNVICHHSPIEDN